jgi:hypothetical protein
MDSLIDTRSPQTRFNLWAHRNRVRDQNNARDEVKGIREEVAAFYLDGLAMLRRGKAAGIDKDALDLMARALYDAVGGCIGKMETTLCAAGCDLDPAQVDRSELDAFLEEVK